MVSNAHSFSFTSLYPSSKTLRIPFIVICNRLACVGGCARPNGKEWRSNKSVSYFCVQAVPVFEDNPSPETPVIVLVNTDSCADRAFLGTEFKG